MKLGLRPLMFEEEPLYSIPATSYIVVALFDGDVASYFLREVFLSLVREITPKEFVGNCLLR